jgi:hypothetical protein
MSSSRWQIVGRVATLTTEHLTAIINADDPAAGLRIENLCGQAIAGAALFGVQIESSIPADATALVAMPSPERIPVDCFVRGNDFVATYAETAERPFRAQVYWRFVENDRSGGSDRAQPFATLELIVSVQTSRLDIDMALAVSTTLGSVEAWRLFDAGESRLTSDRDSSHGAPAEIATVVPDMKDADHPGCTLLRPIGQGPSYIEMVHPADFRQTTFEWTTDSSPAVRLAHRLFAERLEKGVILRSRIRGLFVPRSHDTELAQSEYRRFAASELPLTT